MTHSAADKLASDESGHRRSVILNAAERCFVRSGFHRTTMHDVAAEAGMSPGNIYRYFQSKDDLIVGIVERNRGEVSRSFAPLAGADDLVGAFIALGRKHFAEFPAAKAALCLEIWAEASRNPAAGRINAAFDEELVDRMAAVFAAAKARGQAAADVDPAAVARIVSLLADGLFIRRAIAPDFDAEREIGHVFAVVEALLQGAVRLP